jgi:peptidoglycan/LPS O-acetylase OafA/YrhL
VRDVVTEEAVPPRGLVGSTVAGTSDQPLGEHSERSVLKRKRRRIDAAKRLDIQGLRMVAVLLVVVSHMFDGARGALVGVDVFFVISGFLITGVLLRELQETSRVSLAGFYRRRIRRIVPAATLALVAITVASYLLFTAFRFKQTLTDAVWAFLFAANWHFASEGTNYLNAQGPVSPVQHYWSLSVEEQFYFVWPGLILLIGVISHRWWTRGKFALAVCVLGVVVTASVAYAFMEGAHDPALTYFSSFARAWELGLGAMLAITADYLKRIPNRLRPIIQWMGLIAIGLGAFIPSDVRVFPLQHITIAVVGAGMVIIAGTGAMPRYSTILTNRLSVYLGDVSYSLYLWHWPVIVFLAILMPGGAYFRIAALLLMFGLAVAAYEFFENPIRHSNWLGPKTSSKRDGTGSHTRRRSSKKLNIESLQRAGAVSLAMVTAGAVIVALTPATTTRVSPNPFVINSRVQADSADRPPPDAQPADEQPERAKLSQEISDALRAEKWPELSPSLDEVVAGSADSYIKECIEDARNSITDCARGALKAPHTIVIVGDSTSMSYAGAFESLVNDSNGQWRVELRNYIGCSLMEGHFQLPDFVDEAKEQACPGHVEETISAIEAERPEIVVVTNGYWPHKFVSNGTAQTLKEREDSIRNVVLRISKSAGKVILMQPPPYSANTRVCYTKVSTPKDCVGSVPQWWPDYESVDRSVVDGVDNTSFVTTWRWFCSQDGLCPAFAGALPIRYDSHHLTGAFSRRLGPVVREAFSAVGVTF